MKTDGSLKSAVEVKAILAARSGLGTWLLTAYMRRIARRHFHGIRVARGSLPAIDPDRALIVYANHPSWWDPVVLVLLQAYAFPRRAGFGPMDAQALGRYGMLRRIGVFGIEHNTRRGAARFLRVGAGILQTPNTSLWITAEGGFTDPRQRPVRLRPGVAHLLHSYPDAVAVPLALEFPFWNESRPEALARFGEPITGGAGRTVAAWDILLAERLTETMDRLAQDAITRDPTAFQSVVTGRAGIGGVYDGWRRAGAALQGRRATLEHESSGHPTTGHTMP